MRGEERNGFAGEPGRVDDSTSTLRTMLDEFTVAGRLAQEDSDLNCPGRLVPESLPVQELLGQMRAPPWVNPLEPRGSAYPLRRAELRFPRN
jgi:hypothetical protein